MESEGDITNQTYLVLVFNFFFFTFLSPVIDFKTALKDKRDLINLLSFSQFVSTKSGPYVFPNVHIHKLNDFGVRRKGLQTKSLAIKIKETCFSSPYPAYMVPLCSYYLESNEGMDCGRKRLLE